MGEAGTLSVMECPELRETRSGVCATISGSGWVCKRYGSLVATDVGVRPIKQLYDALDDNTTMQAGAKSYMAALSYYNSVKYTDRSGIPGAKAVYEDIKNRFTKKTANSSDETV
ncbi:hypothetical protein [uncultured Sunxiuqinia sp.]|uniref:hypothetical protein n=1 Tax=uncultured Sunxiuqinia sp. TaxID=1573825 RepID=UPI0030DC266C|tara:strand:- start:5288 stop:5629 length:342 start_codon:yes stop_codon:yes gene_type:complete